MSKRHVRNKTGFSLVEVCLAVLVVGLGVLAIFALFPTGLAASEAAVSDTDAGLFADWAMNRLHARAAQIQALPPATAWSEWKNRFMNGVDLVVNAATLKDGVAYYLEVNNPAADSLLKQATLYALPWKDSTVPTRAYIEQAGYQFYTEFYFKVLP